jgi:hypothetical protein
LVVEDDGNLIDLQIFLALSFAFTNHFMQKLNINILPDMSSVYAAIFDDDKDISSLGFIFNRIEMIWTNFSKNYIYDKQSIVKMPQREDDNAMFLINLIYERQIKRVIQ